MTTFDPDAADLDEELQDWCVEKISGLLVRVPTWRKARAATDSAGAKSGVFAYGVPGNLDDPVRDPLPAFPFAVVSVPGKPGDVSLEEADDSVGFAHAWSAKVTVLVLDAADVAKEYSAEKRRFVRFFNRVGLGIRKAYKADVSEDGDDPTDRDYWISALQIAGFKEPNTADIPPHFTALWDLTVKGVLG